MRLLRYHDWPGNVRELQNYVERAVILGSGAELTVDHLPPQLLGQSPPRPIRPKAGGTDLTALCGELVRQGIRAAGPTANDLYNRIVGQIERELIQQVLRACDSVQIKAACRLGINRNTLHKKLSEYQLDEAELVEITKVTNPSTTAQRNGSFDDSDFDEDGTANPS
jgi:two-component system, NtrC family, response regulator AtoC